MSFPTTEKLAQALHARGLFEMERKAREGYYDDFKSPLATPRMQLVEDLDIAASSEQDLQLKKHIYNLAHEVRRGDFDATKEESDAWAKSADGKATFKELLSGQ